MTDLEKLASEITPGPWKLGKEVWDDAGYYRIESRNKSVLFCECSRFGRRVLHPNAMAMALVPDLIAEVLKLREEVKALRKEFNDHLFEQIASQDKSNKQLDVIEAKMVASKERLRNADTEIALLRERNEHLRKSVLGCDCLKE